MRKLISVGALKGPKGFLLHQMMKNIISESRNILDHHRMFPSFLFYKYIKIEKFIIQSYLVWTLKIEKSTYKEPVDFEQWIEDNVVHTGKLFENKEIVAHDGFSTYLRFIIIPAFNHFAAVCSISAERLAVSNFSW
uniref:Uncharacterized protein n=1 Tax=Urocitellus parryii TaxID=9999 RepID=A0A8D2HQ98_UROPR